MAQSVAGTFSGVSASAVFSPPGGKQFNVSLTFAGTATVQLQRSFDGTNWFKVKEYTASASEVGEEPEAGVTYRLSCTAHTDDVTYRLSR